MKGDEEHIRVIFYVKGEKNRGKATVEMANINGVWECRLLLVEAVGKNYDSISLINNL